jgi:hypothetical protein
MVIHKNIYILVFIRYMVIHKKLDVGEDEIYGLLW